MTKLADLVDMFPKLNTLNTSLQGKNKSIVGLKDGIEGLTAPLSLWPSQLAAGECEMFPVLSAYQHIMAVPLSDSGKHKILEHMSVLQENIQQDFPDSQGSLNLQWVKYLPSCVLLRAGPLSDCWRQL